jgi:hypothetical protein
VWQLAAYMTCLRAELGLYMPVEAHIYCPRIEQSFDCPDHPYEETLAKIRQVIERCKEPNAPLNAKPSACKFCKARAICTELNRELQLVVADRCELTPTIRAKRREFLALVESWAERVKEEDRQHLLNGGEIPGWELRTRRGPRFIPDPYTAWLRLRQHLGQDEIMGAVKMEIGKIEEAFAKREGFGETKKERIAFCSVVLGDTIQLKPDYTVVLKTKGA